jgi:uncharacterized protein YeaO (DUF488 family)
MKKERSSSKPSDVARHPIRVMRIYDAPKEDRQTARFLVDRLWPRGIRKDSVHVAGWVKEAAPSAELRKWFQHDRKKWPEVRRRYCAELEEHPEAWAPLLEAARSHEIVLLFGARDVEHNNAVALKEFLEKQLGGVRKTRAE